MSVQWSNNPYWNRHSNILKNIRRIVWWPRISLFKKNFYDICDLYVEKLIFRMDYVRWSPKASLIEKNKQKTYKFVTII